MSDPVIRKADSCDAGLLVQVSLESGKNVAENYWLNELCLPFSHCWLAFEASNRPVAYLLAWCVEDEWEIHDILTHPCFRRKGYGGLLLQSFLNLANYDGVCPVFLEVREDNETAIKLYQRFNFKKYGVRKNYYGNGQNAILMKREESFS